MKKILLITGLFFAMIGFTNAQKTESVETYTKSWIKEMTPKLNLTPAEVEKLKPAVTEFFASRQANMTKYANDKKEEHNANAKASNTLNDKVNAVLTAEQQKTFKEINEKKTAKEAPAEVK
jgi:hypothetical protein